jgi:predicted alpha/beta hydrolase family esterase
MFVSHPAQENAEPEMTVLLLPGLGDSGPEHWQTHWESEYGYERVQQKDWDTPQVEDWVACLHERIVADDRPKVLVAHSLACSLVAYWARAHQGNVVSALLVAPSDVEGQNYPVGPLGFAPMPMWHLPFPTLVVAGDDDPYVPLQRGQAFASAWGSKYILLGGRGHLGSAAKLGRWPEGHALLRGLNFKSSKPIVEV